LKNGVLRDPKVSVEVTKPRASPVFYQSPAPDGAYDSANPFLLKGKVESVKIEPAGILLTVAATSRSIDGQAVPDTRTWTVNTGGSTSSPEEITAELTGKTLYMWGYPKAGQNCATACEMYAPDYVIPAPKQAGLMYQTFEVNPIQPFPNGGYAFAAKFDANAPVRIAGVIEKVEIGLPYTRVLVRGAAADGREKLWLADGPRPAALSDEMYRKLLAGASVTIRGYLAKDKTCDPACRVNARDLQIN
ncbi:MAG TPA: hypothetical protein VG942_00730, partial [Hyphomonadaceae bacterium]|nr:hypothetical protein [Hyphomonadaceae bacterium]